MGISDGLEGGPKIDCSVGAIVWVRRRNGSWWPGRILGSDELSASHVMSPRSGTPVKLLGREDASVDWYNLEKSKRVKAFRCGEFDDCIEKAESSQSIPPKKREKYARREDAILHALELERHYLGKKHKKFSVSSNCTSYKMPSTVRKVSGSCIPTENYFGNDKMRDHCKFIDLKTQSLSKDENISHSKDILQGRYAKQQNGQDDNSEAVPRMRGLQDLGLRTASSKRKPSASVTYGGPPKPFLVDNHGFDLPSVGHDLGTVNHTNGGKNSSAVKRKRSQSSLTEDSLIKRRDKRRPLVQVLQSSVKLPDVWSMRSDGDAISTAKQGEGQEDVVYQSKRSSGANLPQSNDCLDHTGFSLDKMQMSPSHIGADDGPLHPSLLIEENTSSGLIKAQESDSSETDYSNLDMGEEATLLSDYKISGRYVDHGGSALGVPEQPGNGDNEELEESELSSYVSHLHFNEQAATVASDMGGSSNWQSKGKRNIRNLTKRPMEIVEGRDYINRGDKHNGSICELRCGSRGNALKTARMGSQSALRQGVYSRHEEFNYAYEEGSSIRNDFGPIQMLGYGSRRYPSILKASSQGRGSNITDSDDDSHEMTLSAWEGDQISQTALRGFREESDQCFDLIYAGHLGARMEPMLMDVDLKVQASYQGERVPLVSLMSRLNGKAIIGHPVQIEILEDGSSGHLLSRVGVCEEPTDGNGNAALPTVWRTARRTTMHRPRSHPSSAIEGEELDPPQFSDIESKPPLRKPYSSLASHKERLVKKNPHIGRPPADKKSSKKASKKISLSNQKTRTLSSIATEQKLSGKNSNRKLAGKFGNLDGTIKSMKTSPPVTCIPVKLVFSRIMEAVGRPPSKAVNHRTLAAGLAERKPL